MTEQHLDNSYSFMAPRADLRQEVFDTAIEQKGYRVLWEKGMFCSCYRSDTGQPDPVCSFCGGKGYFYFDPEEIKILVTSINGHKDQERIGLNDFGTAYATFASYNDVGFRDRFTILDFTTKFSQVIYRDSSLQDTLRYPAKDVVLAMSGGTKFIQDVNFTLSTDGKTITWNSDVAPTYQTAFSILYHINPVYIAIGPVHELRGSYTRSKMGGLDQFIKLPSQYMIKREDFIVDGE